MTLSKSSSRTCFSSRSLSVLYLYFSFVILNFSRIYAANPIGEAATAVPLSKIIVNMALLRNRNR